MLGETNKSAAIDVSDGLYFELTNQIKTAFTSSARATCKIVDIVLC